MTTNELAITKLTEIGSAISDALEGEKDSNVVVVVNYFVSLIPTQVALLKSSEAPEVVALAHAILGR